MLCRNFFAVFLGCLCGFSLVKGLCPSGQFGSSCQFQCRCAGGGPCDVTTGDCGQADCQPGFMGPACQQVNSANGVYNSPAFDGQTSTCETRTSFRVAATTGRIRMTWLRVISNASSTSWQVKQELGRAMIDCPGAKEVSSGQVWDWYCPSTNPVDALIVSPLNSTSASACEIQAYLPPTTNVAVRKPAVQSGTWGGPDYINGSYINYNFSANLAVDGYSTTDFSLGSCIVTGLDQCNLGRVNPFWQVDLQGVFDLYAITIYNRRDNFGNSHGARFRGFALSLNSSQGWRQIYKDISPVAVPSETQVPVSTVQTATGVRVSLEGCNYLQICEVVVDGIATCPDGTYGVECNRNCACQNSSEVCHKITGACSQCPLGKRGLDCSLDCLPGTFGQRCREQCSTRCRDSLCDVNNGSCNNCVAGWRGSACDERCPNGTYGDSCLGECSSNCQGSCHHETGSCLNGCEAGWMGSKCLQECSSGKFGQNCTLGCPSNCQAGACHHVTGQCSQGCREGWMGERCVQAVPKSSSIVAIAAGSAGGAVVIIIVIIVIVLLLVRRRRPKMASEDQERMTSSRSSGHSSQHYVNAALAPEPVPKRDPVEEDLDTEVEVEGVKMEGVEMEGGGGEDVAVYYNTQLGDCSSTEIKMADLPSRLKKWRRTNHFAQEFANLPSGLSAPYTAALNLQNKKKNRYKNICAYDHSRVKLAEEEGDPDSTYINACFMDNYSKPNTFIASQGPNDVILEDFLRMLWEYDVRKVVMLTNLVEDGKQKCHQYWPNKGEEKFGCMQVKLMTSTTYADYTVRVLQISKAGDSVWKRVKQFHYTTWPDKDVPDSPWPLLDFREKVMDGIYSDNSPVVVHCSAGIGRTGTFVAINNLLQQAASTGSVDVYQCVRKLRQQRVNIVQTVGQYEFLHEAVLAGRCMAGDCVPVLELPARLAELTSRQPGKPTQLEKIHQMMQDCLFKLLPEECTAANLEENKPKNRSQEILPPDSRRPALLTTSENDSDYINAVFLPSYYNSEMFILTQTPFPSTVVDFWRLVSDYNVNVIVCLDPAMKQSKAVGVYWPREEGKEELGPFKVTQVSTETYNSFSLRNISVVRESEPARDVTVLTCQGWQEGAALPPSPQLLFDVINMASSRRGNRPVLVHCRDGAARGGLFCVLASLLERSDREGEVTVTQTLGVARSIRPQIAPHLAQFRFLYEAALAHVQSSSQYENLEDPAAKPSQPASRDPAPSQSKDAAERSPSGGLYTTMETMAPKDLYVSPNSTNESSSSPVTSGDPLDDSHVYWNHDAL